jgi:WS/DGAT/MGAT family acyltransferase
MVDGLAALELSSALLDPTPGPTGCEPDQWCAAPEPRSEQVLARGLRDRFGQQLGLLRWPLRAAASPAQAARQSVAGAVRVTNALSHSLRGAPSSVLNGPLSPLRALAWTQRPLADLQLVKRAHGTTVNDVMLAAVAGGMRAYLTRLGEKPVALKAMVPVSVRSPGDRLGNHISFVFAALPCDDPRPLGRLYKVHVSMSERKRDGEPEGTDLALKAAAHAPGPLQQTLARLITSPRTFNLVVSNIPGPAEPLYMLGSRLEAVYPVVPLADHHAVSVGMTTVRGQACFGVYADPETLPDVHVLANDIDDAITELLAEPQR